jgi:quercetin dioxygenase-like cupin family protein
LLQSFVPPGPEAVLRDRSKAGGTEVIKGTAPNAPPGAYKLVHEADVQPRPIAGGKGKVWILLEKESTGEDAAYLGVLEADAGAKVPEHKHDGSDEMLFIVKGDCKTIIGGADTPAEDETAIQIPANTLHSATFGAPTRAVQLYTPAGPEQRFKQAPTPAGPQKK